MATRKKAERKSARLAKKKRRTKARASRKQDRREARGEKKDARKAAKSARKGKRKRNKGKKTGATKGIQSLVRQMWKEFEQQLEKHHIPVDEAEFLVKFANKTIRSIGEGMVGYWNSLAKGGWATLGPRMLGPKWEKGTLQKIGVRTFLAPAPIGSTVRIVIEKLDGKAGAKIEANVYDRMGRSIQSKKISFAKKGRSGVRKTFVANADNFGFVAIKLDATMGALRADKFAYRIKYEEVPDMKPQKPVKGIADIHLHQTAEMAFAGNWLHGKHTGPPSSALRPCGSVKNQLMELIFPNQTPFAFHGKGHPTYEDWPHHMDFGHHQAHESWLKNAHRKGLNLVMACPVNNEPLSILLGAMKPNLNPIRDMKAIKKQIKAIHKFARTHKWYEVAYNPWHAREIIHSGKMAVVISAEGSNLFPPDEGNYIDQLDEFYRLGVRCLQIVHEVDNKYAGAAPQEKILSVLQTVKRATRLNFGLGFQLDGKGKNKKGLSTKGKMLIKAAMDRHMLIDASHFSERTFDDVYAIVKKRDYYPIINSHTKFKAVLSKEERDVQREFVTTKKQLACYRRTGGIVGLRTAPWPSPAVKRGAGLPRVKTDTGSIGTARSFAQQVTYAFDNDVNAAFGSDINGFTNQLGPRGPKGKRPSRVSAEYWRHGLRHIGLLPDLAADLVSLKVPGGKRLSDSAERFLKSWERTWVR